MNHVMQPDLFGGESRLIEKVNGPYAQFRVDKYYRPAQGVQNCSTCKYSYQREAGSKRVRKCKIMGASCSPASDVSMKKVCNAYLPMNNSGGN